MYRRRKTGQQLTVKWEKRMEDIIAKYGENTATRYLLPIIPNPSSDERTQYRNAICRINVVLKEVAGLAGLNIPLAMYVVRHCWASVAKSKNIPLSVISEGMGHDSEETTRIYLASLDTSVVDKANSLILKDFNQIFMMKCIERKDESLDKRYILPCKGTNNSLNLIVFLHLY